MFQNSWRSHFTGNRLDRLIEELSKMTMLLLAALWYQDIPRAVPPDMLSEKPARLRDRANRPPGDSSGLAHAAGACAKSVLPRRT